MNSLLLGTSLFFIQIFVGVCSTLYGQELDPAGRSITITAPDHNTSYVEDGVEFASNALYIKVRAGYQLAGSSFAISQALLSEGAELWEAHPVASHIAGAPDTKGFSILSPAQKSARESLERIYVVEYNGPIQSLKLAAALRSNPAIEAAEPIALPVPFSPTEPNDPKLSEQKQVAFTHLAEAWKIFPGDTSIVIGVIDLGITKEHEDLYGNIALNYGEMGTDVNGNDKASNDVDDDGNGYVDDWDGLNLTASTDGRAPNDTRNGEHGTQVAGYCSATPDNGIGVCGSGNQSRFFPVKAGRFNSTRLVAGYEGIVYCAERGFSVINCSWGSPFYNSIEEEIVRNVTEAYDVAIVAGGGNTYQQLLYFPAGYRDVLSVGGIDQLSQFSTTWGEHIDVAATGGLTTSGTSDYYDLDAATSYTTPVVSGIVALLRGYRPDLSARQALAIVRATAVSIDNLNPGREKLVGKGVVNAEAVLKAAPDSIVAFEIDSVWAVDQNGQSRDYFPIGGNGKIRMRINNLLGPAKNAQLRVSRYTSDSAEIDFDTTTILLGDLKAGEVVDIDGVNFVVRSSAGADTRIRLDFQADHYDDYTYERLSLYRPFTVYSTSQLDVTLTDLGRLGFDRLPIGEVGEGVNVNGVPQLYEGGLIIAKDRNHILDNIRSEDDDRQHSDFITIEPPLDSNDSTLILQDNPNEADYVGVRVGLRTDVSEAVANGFVTVISVTNVSNGTIDSLRVGLFTDWDLDYADAFHSIHVVDQPEPGLAVEGIVQHADGMNLSVGVGGRQKSPIFFAIDNSGLPVKILDGFDDDEKWQVVKNGIGNTTVEFSDVSLVMGGVVEGLAPGESDSVVLYYVFDPESAVGAHDGLVRMVNGGGSGVGTDRIQGRSRWTVRLVKTDRTLHVEADAAAPMPTTIELVTVTGQVLKRIRTESRTTVIGTEELPSGNYYLHVSGRDQSEVHPILIVR